MVTVKISSKGQIAIPKEIRKQLRLKEGSEIALEVHEKELVMRKVRAKSWRRWRGVLKGTGMLQDLEREHREELQKDE
jgi:AbrB family looped-hinge helix DNA binding protein